ncbi:unnamed protein product [Ectocarpus fasciculatus]
MCTPSTPTHIILYLIRCTIISNQPQLTRNVQLTADKLHNTMQLPLKKLHTGGDTVEPTARVSAQEYHALLCALYPKNPFNPPSHIWRARPLCYISIESHINRGSGAPDLFLSRRAIAKPAS